MKNSKESGFNLIEIVIASAIFAGVSLAALDSVNQIFSVQTQASLKSNALNLKNNLYFMLDNEAAWDETLKAKNLNCLKKGDCGKAVPFDVRDAQGSLFYQSTRGTSGFTNSGVPCANYPSEDCPIRADVTARVTCSTCEPRQAELDVKFSHHTNRFNLGAQDFTLVKNVPSPPAIVACGAIFNIYGHGSGQKNILPLIGSPSITPGVIVSRDSTTQREICSRVGCGPPLFADAGRFKSCGNNGLIRFNGSRFARVGGCFGGGWHMSNMRCAVP